MLEVVQRFVLVWDATCSDTFTLSYVADAAHELGAVAAKAEERKILKYSHFDNSLSFVPVVVETAGGFWPAD